MGWRVWGDDYTTTAMTNRSIFQPVVFDKNYIVRGARTWVIAYNDPVFTSITMECYSNNAGSPKTLLFTATNVITKAQMITLTNGVKEIYFDFNFEPVKANDVYHFVLYASGYTGSPSSHLAWKKGFPDPVLFPGGIGFKELLVYPHQLYFIGSEL